MKIIQTGTTYKVYGEELIVLDNLPVQTYKVGFGQFTGFFLEQISDLEIKEDKIYGVHEEKANKVINRYNKSIKNLGVILSGDKGIGKSLFARLLAQKAIENGMPVILVDNYIQGVNNFLDNIKEEVLILFDEFDKTFSKERDNNPQDNMLSLFDGTSSGKKLFVITCNRYQDLSQFLLNRPGRFHFHFRFEYPNADEVKIYLKDKLDKKYYSEINKVVSFSRKIKLNYDCLSAIALELNEGEIFEDAIKDLNILNTYDKNNNYDITLYTEEGIVFKDENININLFNSNPTSIWVDNDNSQSVFITFKGSDAKFDEFSKTFIINNDKFTIKPEDDSADNLKHLHYTYAELTLRYDNNLHYIL